MTPEAPKGAPGGTKKHPGTTFGWSKSTRDPPREHQEAPASTRGTRKHPGTNFGWSKSTREQGAPREHPGTTNEHQGAPGGTKKHPGTTFGWSKSTMELPGTPRMQGSPGSSRTHPGTIFGWSKSTRDLRGSTQGALGGVAWCTQINGKFYLVARPPYFLYIYIYIYIYVYVYVQKYVFVVVFIVVGAVVIRRSVVVTSSSVPDRRPGTDIINANDVKWSGNKLTCETETQ
jgi:hypothetical protein